MAKRGITFNFTPYTHTDPVTHSQKQFMRNAHNVQTSPRLKEFQNCMRDGLSGKTFRGGTPKENAVGVRAAFVDVARSCKRG